MSEFMEAFISEPPTSGAVQELAISSLYEGAMNITVIGQQEVPRPAEETVEFKIRQTFHPEDGGMIIAGRTEDHRSVVIRAPEDETLQATATIIGRRLLR